MKIEKKVINNAILLNTGLVVDQRDGELIKTQGTFIVEEEVIRRRNNYKEKEKRNEIERYKLERENADLKEKLGIIDSPRKKIYDNFIWTYFIEQQLLFPDLQPQDISRLVYLSTYADYNTNILLYNQVPIQKSNLNQLMKLNKKTYYEWLNKMVEHQYITFNGQNVIINNNFLNKGDKKKNSKAIRLFIDMIRELYLNLEPKDHHKMGLVLQLIPFINPHFNCLAKNPQEKEKEKLVPLRLSELADRLGYSQRQCRRLGNEILSIRYGEDKKRIAIAIALDDLSPQNHILIFNAKLFFSGKVDEYKLVNRIFEDYQPTELFEIDI